MKILVIFLLLLVVLCCSHVVNGFQKLSPKQHFVRFRGQASARRLQENYEGRIFNPIKYGADPTGVRDSSDAFSKAIQDAFVVQNKKQMLPGVNDLGGVLIDLKGGDYKLSTPIRFPPNGGANVVIQDGSLRASENFPSTCYLVQLWSPATPRGNGYNDPCNPNTNTTIIKTPLGVYYEDITFRDILFDSNFRGGGFLGVNTVRIRIYNCYFVRFTTDGILVEGGHEVFVSSSFLGQIETIGGDKKEKAFYGTAINLAGNDHAVTDVAIFSAATGVLLRGQANILTGVHCYNKATFFGGVGIHATTSGSKTRIDNCYLDYNSILLEDPSETHITNTFFLGDGNVKLKAVKGEAKGLTVVNNMFSGNNGWVPIVQLDESQAKFQKVEQAVVDNNMVNTMALKTTVARMTVAGKGKHWTADFRSVLTFPDLINHVSYSLYLKGGNRLKIPRHAITAVVNNTVVVESSEIVDAIVSVAVDQYLALGETNYL